MKDNNLKSTGEFVRAAQYISKAKDEIGKGIVVSQMLSLEEMVETEIKSDNTSINDHIKALLPDNLFPRRLFIDRSIVVIYNFGAYIESIPLITSMDDIEKYISDSEDTIDSKSETDGDLILRPKSPKLFFQTDVKDTDLITHYNIEQSFVDHMWLEKHLTVEEWHEFAKFYEICKLFLPAYESTSFFVPCVEAYYCHLEGYSGLWNVMSPEHQIQFIEDFFPNNYKLKNKKLSDYEETKIYKKYELGFRANRMVVWMALSKVDFNPKESTTYNSKLNKLERIIKSVEQDSCIFTEDFIKPLISQYTLDAVVFEDMYNNHDWSFNAYRQLISRISLINSQSINRHDSDSLVRLPSIGEYMIKASEVECWNMITYTAKQSILKHLNTLDLID
jgi:hypothetical protein